MRVVFMGTPDFAVDTLELLLEKHEVLAVFTQPDKPKGRGKKLTSPPVKCLANSHDISVFQPMKIREGQWVELLEQLNPDAIVVVAYGQILSQQILDIPKYGCINVHASLLPKYRGAAPINWAIVHGEKETGVTTMLMDAGLDTGDMLLKSIVPITRAMTAEILHDQLAKVGAELLLKTLTQLENGNISRIEQNSLESSYAPMLSKEIAKIDWSESAEQIFNKIRGFNAWPVAHTSLLDIPLKIFKAGLGDSDNLTVSPGTIIHVAKDSFSVQTGQGVLEVEEIQWGSNKRMTVAAFLLGHKLEVGQQLENKNKNMNKNKNTEA